jgi:hypothetical protein
MVPKETLDKDFTCDTSTQQKIMDSYKFNNQVTLSFSKHRRYNAEHPWLDTMQRDKEKDRHPDKRGHFPASEGTPC